GMRRPILWVGLEVEHLHHEVRAREAVDRAVVHLADDRDVTVLQPLDDPELPERTVAVEWPARDVAGDLRDLLRAAGTGNADPTDVVVEVEVRVVDPHRQTQPERDRCQPTT